MTLPFRVTFPRARTRVLLGCICLRLAPPRPLPMLSLPLHGGQERGMEPRRFDDPRWGRCLLSSFPFSRWARVMGLRGRSDPLGFSVS